MKLGTRSNEFTTKNVLSLNHLPELVLVKIMKLLSERDKYHLSLTCSNLYHAFYDPSLWSVVKVNINGGSPYFSEKNIRIFQTFGHMIQNLNLRVYGDVLHIDLMCEVLFQCLQTNCRLEALTLDIGQTNWEFSDVAKPFKPILQFLENCSTLKELNLKSWHKYLNVARDYPYYDIYISWSKNKHLANLTGLNFFYVSDSQWSDLPIIRSSHTTQMLSGFRNLNRLSLLSCMVNEDVLLVLLAPGRAKLELLQILVLDTDYNDRPDMDNDLWKRMMSAHPNLKVEITFKTKIFYHRDLVRLLKPDIPLSSLTILENGRYNYKLFPFVTKTFNKTLESFVSLCRGKSSDADEHLVRLVNGCELLTELAYHGDLKLSTISQLSDLGCRKLTKLDFGERDTLTIEA